MRAESSEKTIGMVVVRALVDAAEHASITRADFLRAAHLSAAQLDSATARVSGLRIYRMCELALDLSADPAFGLHWAERLHGNALGPVSHLIAHAGTLRQGLEAFSKFEVLLSDIRCHQLIEEGDTVKVRCRFLPPSPRMHRFAAEMILGFFFRLLRAFDRQSRPHTVSFQYGAPSYEAEYARFFEGTACFDQPFTEIVFDRGLLDRPGPHRDDDLSEALHTLAERRLLRIAHRTPYSLRVRDVIVRRGFPLRTDMASVARALGLSTRSLRRRLASEGKSYSAIVGEAMATLAKDLLLQRRLTIQETAHAMGFSDPRTFHRAFKRWTGLTPSVYRDGLQSH